MAESFDQTEPVAIADTRAVDNGDGTVDLPLPAHGFVAGQDVTISGTTNYDGTYTLGAQADPDWLTLTATYVAEQLAGGSVRDPDDLQRVRVGVVRVASAAEELTDTHIGYRPYETLEDGLRALESGELDAFVHDRPILLYCQAHEKAGRIQVLPGFFDPQLYGFAFPRGSTLRKAVNIALLRRMEDYAYRQRVFGPYLGKAGVH